MGRSYQRWNHSSGKSILAAETCGNLMERLILRIRIGVRFLDGAVITVVVQVSRTSVGF